MISATLHRERIERYGRIAAAEIRKRGRCEPHDLERLGVPRAFVLEHYTAIMTCAYAAVAAVPNGEI